MRQRFTTQQWLPLPVPVVFAFFANPANLPPLMPTWQKARIDAVALRPAPPPPEGTPTGIAAGDGTEITITARALPWLPLRGSWLARIEGFRWNQGFCDVQVRGPFRFWRHCHSVQEAPEAGEDSAKGTLIRDEVEYELPLLGSVASVDRFVARPALRRVFECRQKQARNLLFPPGNAL